MNDEQLGKMASEAVLQLKVGYHDEGMTRWDCVPYTIILTALKSVQSETRALVVEECARVAENRVPFKGTEFLNEKEVEAHMIATAIRSLVEREEEKS